MSDAERELLVRYLFRSRLPYSRFTVQGTVRSRVLEPGTSMALFFSVRGTIGAVVVHCTAVLYMEYDWPVGRQLTVVGRQSSQE